MAATSCTYKESSGGISEDGDAVAGGAGDTLENGALANDALGMRVGGGFFDLASFRAAEAQLGGPIFHTVQFTGRMSVQDMTGSAFGLFAGDDADLPLVADELDISVAVPLAFGRANSRTADGRDQIAVNLAETAAGAHDAEYRRVGERIVEAGYPDAIIRLGHEFNGLWAPWSSRGNEATFVAAWRHVHDVLSDVSPEFRFDWTTMRPDWETWAPAAWPGDSYVDIVGLDMYWREGPWNPTLWASDYQPALESHLAFAREHGKPVSFPEWAVAGDDVPQFVSTMAAWMNGLPTAGPGRLDYHAYFNTRAQYLLGNYPESEATFIRLFGSAS